MSQHRINLSGVDAFGRRPEDYEHFRPLIERKCLEGHLAGRAENYSLGTGRRTQPHNFDVNWEQLRSLKLEDDSAPIYNFVRNQTESINSMVKEILYRNEVFKMFLPIHRDVDEGDTSYSYRIIDRRGKAAWVDTRGSTVGTVRVTQSKQSAPLKQAGVLIELSDENLRLAVKSGIMIEPELMEAGVQAILNQQNEVALLGDKEWGWKGLVNWPTTGTGKVARFAIAKTFRDSSGEEIRKVISDAIGRLITDSKEIIPKQITGQLCVILTPDAFNRLTDPLGDNKDHSIESFLSMNNPWSRRTRRPILFETLQELVGAGQGGTDRMAIGIKDKEVVEFPMAIDARALRTIEKEFGFTIPLESKFGGTWITRPFGWTYGDGT